MIERFSPVPEAGALDWEGEGQRIGASLDQLHCVVVLGEDVEATALVALGVALSQSGHRRVAVGDLLDEAPPLQRLVESDDPHGLVDSFLFGVSLNRIARPVADAGELYILPSGSQPIDYEEMLPNGRWRRLASGFREVGALLVLAAPASAPAVERLVEATDGAILVGDVVPPQLPVAQVIASVRPRPRVVEAEEPAVVAESGEATTPASTRRWRFPRVPLPAAVGGVLAASILALTGLWLASRPFDRGHAPPSMEHLHDNRTPDSAAGVAGTPIAPTPDTTTQTVDASEVPDVADPADSAQAAAYAVSWLKLNSQAGAMMRLQRDGTGIPASTYTPIAVNGAPWFELRIGAYATQADAESLLATLRGNELVPADQGVVIRAPLAFVIDSASSEAAAKKLVSTYLARQLPVYALRLAPRSRSGGYNWRLYVGAFTTPIEASLYAKMLRDEGIAPVLVYRIGRVN